MQLSDAGNQVASRPSPNPTVSPGWFNNNPTGGSPATIVDADLLNSIMAELSAIIDAGTGAALSKSLTNQTLTAIQALIAAGSGAVVGNARRLIGSSTGAQTASWTAKEIVAKTGLGLVAYLGANLTLNFNGATTGAGGMDTGTMSGSGDLSIYAIYNPTSTTWDTLGCLASASNGPTYTGAHMPAGYTASAPIWAGVMSGGDFISFVQADRHIDIGNVSVLSGGSASSAVSISLTSCIPALATRVGGNTAIVGGAGAGAEMGANNALSFGSKLFDAGTSPWENMPILTAQTIWYSATGGASSVTIWVGNYDF